MEVPRRCCEQCGCGLVSALQRCGECVSTYYLPCSRCGHDNAEIRPASLNHAEQVNQRLIKTSAALTQADHTLRTSQEALELAQKAQADALQRYQHLCRQMAEAGTAWAILREKEGQGGPVPIGPAGVVDRGKGLE